MCSFITKDFLIRGCSATFYNHNLWSRYSGTTKLSNVKLMRYQNGQMVSFGHFEMAKPKVLKRQVTTICPLHFFSTFTKRGTMCSWTMLVLFQNFPWFLVLLVHYQRRCNGLNQLRTMSIFNNLIKHDTSLIRLDLSNPYIYVMTVLKL